MKVQVTNAAAFKEKEKLKGLFEVRVLLVKDYPETGRAQLEYEITNCLSGQDPEAQGRRVFEFDLLDLNMAVSSKQANFVGPKIVSRCLCFGLDPENFDSQDFVNQSGKVWIFESENSDTKRTQLEITKFYPRDENKPAKKKVQA